VQDFNHPGFDGGYLRVSGREHGLPDLRRGAENAGAITLLARKLYDQEQPLLLLATFHLHGISLKLPRIELKKLRTLLSEKL